MMVNSYEMTAAGFSLERVIGRNFFTEIAPCENVKAFREPFERAVAEKNLNARFDFLFNLPKMLRCGG
jgi:photoactive yellow protein